MILGIKKELFVFLHAALSGNIVYLSYCSLRVLRRIVRHNLPPIKATIEIYTILPQTDTIDNNGMIVVLLKTSVIIL